MGAKLNDDVKIPFATPNLTDLWYFANPSTGRGFKAQVTALVTLLTSGTVPVKSYADVTAMLANTDIITSYFAYTAATGALYLYLGGDRSLIGSYKLLIQVLDEDNMASDSAVAVPSQQSVRAYVDAEIAAAALGIVTSWKEPVKVATTTAGTLATSFENGDTVNGVVLATGDRILIKDQASQSENGIYVVNATGAPTRASDANTAAELEGAAVMVQQGTVDANTTWIQTTDGITLGSSNLVWTAMGTSVPDASPTTKGIAKLYANLSESNTDGAPDQASVVAGLATKIDKLATYRTVVATHELDATDLASINAGAQLVIILNAGAPLTLEIPTNAVQAFPQGTIICGIQYGTGQVTIAPDATVTMRSPNNANKSFSQYSRFYLEKIGADLWILSGDITV